jgi:predicted dehydrogenase
MTLPEPRVLDADRAPRLRWAVIGIGWISTRFVAAVHHHSGQRVVAVGGRDIERVTAFAREYGIANAYGDPAQAIDDPEVDVVYVGTPHSAHRRLALAAIAAGKHVLVEKPIATSVAEAREIVDAARAAGVFAMEAMWTRYLPQTDVLRRLIENGELGTIQQVVADFGDVVPYDPDGRVWNAQLAGGALLDMAVYPISFASMVLGTPQRVTATGITTADGVDIRSTGLLEYAGGAEAIISTSLISPLPARATVLGRSGRVEMSSPIYAPRAVTLFRHGGEDGGETWVPESTADVHDGLAYQATALATYVGEGRSESPLHGLDETVEVISTIERMREQLTVVDLSPYV